MQKYTVKYDVHVHTGYSFDNDTPMEGYVKRAIECGVSVVCFTDHLEMSPKFNTFGSFLFGKRAEEFHRLQQQYAGQVKLLLGFEVGEPHLHPKEMQFVYSLQPDMIIGSVHRPGDYEQPRSYTNFQYERLYDRYVLEMVTVGGFDVLGHMDMPKRWHSDYVEDTETLHKTLAMCVKNGIVPEINTSELNRRGFTMPTLEAIGYYRSLGGKFVTIGSDSHETGRLAENMLEVANSLPQDVKVVYFENRKPVLLEK